MTFKSNRASSNKTKAPTGKTKAPTGKIKAPAGKTNAPTGKTKAPMSKNGQAPTSKLGPTTTAVIAIHPLSDRVLVQALDAQEKSKSGIIIPDTAKERPTEGRVIAVGPGRMSEDGKRITPEVKKGDTILYGKYSGAEIKLEDEEYLILRETDILAIL